MEYPPLGKETQGFAVGLSLNSEPGARPKLQLDRAIRVMRIFTVDLLLIPSCWLPPTPRRMKMEQGSAFGVLATFEWPRILFTEDKIG